MQHHSTQPYQGQAQSRQLQRSPNTSNSHSNSQGFAVQSGYPQNQSLQSPYLGNPSQFTQQQSQQATQDHPYYTSNPSPRSSNGTTYYPTEKQEQMAAAATMQRPPYPPMYHTPQSNSPASVTSPQAHEHGRPMFSQQTSQMTPSIYPYAYSPLNQMQTPYGSQHASSMTPNQMIPGSYNQSQLPHSQVPSHTPNLNTSPRIKSDPSQSFSQTPQQRPSLLTQHPTPGATPGTANVTPSQGAGASAGSNAAPGPIPATTPLVVRQDNNGVQWIAFEYSRDRVKMEYTIRCDVESVDTNSLATEFKSDNCVYPRACVPRDQYKGNRLTYESDCNQVGWALAELNPCLRGKRGLIQRAVDSWRNSNQDPRLRSRRVRRQAKINNKPKASSAGLTQPTGAVPTGLPGPSSMPVPGVRGPNSLSSAGSQVHHHHGQHDITSPTVQDPSSASSYSNPQSMHRPASTNQHLSSPNDMRHAQTFPGYQPYPQGPSALTPSMAPPMPGSIHQYARPPGNTVMVSSERRKREDDDTELFGDLPEGKKRKFILVDDTQKSARVRVKVTLDTVNVQDIPDSYRRQNSVYPRSYYPIQMQAEPAAGRFAAEDAESEGAPTVGKMTVPCTTTGGESQVEVSQLTRSKREREGKINELGYRMAWGQGRVFSNRPIFLARALDAYRTKQRSALVGAGQDTSTIPSHLEVRPGKRRWFERTRPGSNPSSPQPKLVEEAP
ncbi:hypothetical protein LTR64_005894 [Lithohypha guttulata]|uniref:DUF8032 domain-containing protein n=1 Tax=Lithohypha guttulata TaxID=1690604 RepID=A0AAN7Y954_9EURO|nr:hypothetical protein LTR51_002310 [Lithohypha guttulata]KAK5089967.1 hypothetical protein LTR05_000135 [Lithohypha guttulata]